LLGANVEIFCCLSETENFENFDEDLVDIYDQHKYLQCKKLILKKSKVSDYHPLPRVEAKANASATTL
jgi:hypothetical protein